MRKQYHFQPSSNGFMAWDVDRLIALSKHFPIIEVPIREIKELDEAFWFGGPTDKPTCRAITEHAKLIQEVDTDFPVILFSNGRVADGMHRICRLYMEGASIVNAVRFSVDPQPDYINVMPDELPY